MLTESAVRRYVESCIRTESPELLAVRRRVTELGLDHEEIRLSQMAFFQTICCATNASKILELGTFLGDSTIGLARVLPDQERLCPLIATQLVQRKHAD